MQILSYLLFCCSCDFLNPCDQYFLVVISFNEFVIFKPHFVEVRIFVLDDDSLRQPMLDLNKDSLINQCLCRPSVHRPTLVSCRQRKALFLTIFIHIYRL